jgi:hypothetical protein
MNNKDNADFNILAIIFIALAVLSFLFPNLTTRSGTGLEDLYFYFAPIGFMFLIVGYLRNK